MSKIEQKRKKITKIKDLKKFCKIALVQAEPVLFDKKASLAKVVRYIDEAVAQHSDRLGHEKIQTTLNTYNHLYPNKQAEVTAQLENVINGTTVPNGSPMAGVTNL